MKRSHKNRDHNEKKATREPKKKYEFEVEEMEERIAPASVTNYTNKENQDAGGFWR
ncbi:MAG: hypothetical protein HYU64_02020 [Armatimonadetes bacterium]|nr:hypothetical protein [Armatimonadota bacterium]